MSYKRFEEISQSAVHCRFCFKEYNLEAAHVDVAQPRYVGQEYWIASKRVALMFTNPGGGRYRKDDADTEFLRLLRSYRDGEATLSDVMKHQADDIENWGRGRLSSFISDLGFSLEEIALANVAWCATADNNYPQGMLNTCFARHTQSLLRILNPNVLLLCGTKAKNYLLEVKSVVPQAKIIPTLHYAHRKGAAATANEVERIRTALEP